MKYILDSSVAVKWVLPEIDSDKAERLRDDFSKGLLELLSPEFFHVELAHALTRAERQGRIAVGEAEDLWNEVMTTPPQFMPSYPLMARAIQISSSVRLGVYDCVYLALAEREAYEFITADDKIIKNAGTRFGFILPLSNFT